MGKRFELQVTLFRLPAEIGGKGAFDVMRVGVVPLDQVGIIAVHGANGVGQGGAQPLGQTIAQTGDRKSVV